MKDNNLKSSIINIIEEEKENLIFIAKDLWTNPEEAYNEHHASKIQREYLEKKGFTIKLIESMDTAFIAECGEGEPIIGILGEYDALPGLSQKVCSHKEAIVEDGIGHGCGHNLLGTAGLGSVVALREVMKDQKLSGTIRYYGCPAEEGGAGKVEMGKRGVFDDLACAFTWHPFDINTPIQTGTLANFSVKFRFKGTSSHAAQAPYNGRSALDGVELMNVGVNYLREHLTESTKVHYIITNGGERPNIVPDFSEVWYYIRGEKARDVKEAFHRIINVAKGAALMTETKMEYKIKTAVYDYLPNAVLNKLILDNLKIVGPPKHTEADKIFARELCKDFTQEDRWNVCRVLCHDEEIIEKYLHEEIVTPLEHSEHYLYCSTDVGDVSHMIPTGQLSVAAWPIGTPAHTWQSCAA